MAEVSPTVRRQARILSLSRLASAGARAVGYMALLVGAAFTLYPVLFMLSGSFKTTSELFALPPTLIPPTWQFVNYHTLFTQRNFPLWYLNSLIVVAIRLPLSLFLCSLGAFALAKYEFPGKKLIFWLVIAVIMVPFEAIYVPLYFMMVSCDRLFTSLGISWLSCTNSYVGLIVPFAASAFGIFMLRQYIVSIPDELIHAAKVDGASGFWIYWHVILPLSRPAMGAIAIIFFLGTWNSFLWPLVILQKDRILTLPLGMIFLLSSFETMGQRWDLVMGAALLAILPLLLTFLVMQKQFIAGLTTGGVKGV